jgi:hypothetical protein
MATPRWSLWSSSSKTIHGPNLVLGADLEAMKRAGLANAGPGPRDGVLLVGSESMNRIRHVHAVVTAVATLALICLGGLVTSHGVGLAVPDWPNTYGYNMFFFPISDWVGGIFYEHTHRLLGSLVGLMTLVLTLWLYGTGSRPWLKWGGAMLGIGGLLWAAWVSGRKDWALLVAATGGVAFAVSWVWPRCAPAPRLLRWLGCWRWLGWCCRGFWAGSGSFCWRIR